MGAEVEQDRRFSYFGPIAFGMLAAREGDERAAMRHFKQALEVIREADVAAMEMNILASLARSQLAVGDTRAALASTRHRLGYAVRRLILAAEAFGITRNQCSTARDERSAEAEIAVRLAPKSAFAFARNAKCRPGCLRDRCSIRAFSYPAK